MTFKLAAALDHTKISGIHAAYVLAETIKPVGRNSSALVLSRQTINEIMEKFAFKAVVPLTIHCNCKIMLEICGENVVYRTPYDAHHAACWAKFQFCMPK